MSRQPSMAILGAGRVGTCLGLAFRQAGFPVVAVASRTEERARTTAARLETRPVPLDTIHREADILWVTVADNALTEVAAAYAPLWAERADLLVVHCSGALPAELLQPNGGSYAVGGFHPMLSFATPEVALANLPGSAIGVEGTAKVRERLTAIATAIGGEPVAIPAGGKVLYHAAACVASNYTTALMAAAEEFLEAAGVDGTAGRKALVRLVQGTLGNIGALGPRDALTGPISRGDDVVVARHLEALADHPELASLYRFLGERALTLAESRGLSQDRGDAVRMRLREERDDG